MESPKGRIPAEWRKKWQKTRRIHWRRRWAPCLAAWRILSLPRPWWESGGLGGKIQPAAILVIQNGQSRLINVKGQDGPGKLLDMVPELIQKFTGGKGFGAKKEKAEKSESAESPESPASGSDATE